MNDAQYLAAVLKEQELTPGSTELTALQERREAIEALLRDSFSECSPTIRYGGSRAKGTMIRDDYDLDLICYLAHEETGAGETLKEIYENVRDALKSTYAVQEKTSAIRLVSAEGVDFHVDVVPGRFIDETETDTFLYQRDSDKERLKTNLQVHIDHIRESGFQDAIRIMKLWRYINSVQVRTFPLELMTIELLRKKKGEPLSVQIAHVLQQFRDCVSDICIEDPANPSGNDLSSLLDASVRHGLSTVAQATLTTVGNFGWQQVFGPASMSAYESSTALKTMAAVSTPTRPWCAT